MALEDFILTSIPINLILASFGGYILYSVVYSENNQFPKLTNTKVIANSVLIGLAIFLATYGILTNVVAPEALKTCPDQMGGCLNEIAAIMQGINFIFLALAIISYLFVFSIVGGSIKDKLPIIRRRFPRLVKWIKDFIAWVKTPVFVFVYFAVIILFFLSFVSANYKGTSFYGEQVFLEKIDSNLFINIYLQNDSQHDLLLNKFVLTCHNTNIDFNLNSCATNLPQILPKNTISKVSCALAALDLNLFDQCTTLKYYKNGYTPQTNYTIHDQNLLSGIN